MMQEKRIAIVYDWFDKWGGAERILLYLNKIYPNADYYTSYFNTKLAYWAKDLKIRTSFIQKLPSFIKNNRLLSLPLYPYAFESFNFADYEIVISVTSSFAKGIVTKPDTFHICYLLTPTRYLWLNLDNYLTNAKKNLLSGFIKYLQQWDKIAAQRPDKIVSISKTAADRCLKYYNRESEIIYPPFDLDYWEHIKTQNSLFRRGFGGQVELKTIEKEKYYLIVSRLEPYKKVDLAIKVFNKLPAQNLVVVGNGSQAKTLKRIANSNIRFFNDLTDLELALFYTKAQALIMTQEEDFGYTALEALAMDCPVIAYNKGGAIEILTEGQTALFFKAQTEKALSDSLERFHILSYNFKNNIKKNNKSILAKFSQDNFEKLFKQVINY